MSLTLKQRLIDEQVPNNHCSELNQPVSVQSNTPAASPSNYNLMVIGAGLMRTGTTSLKHALEHLYQQPCYHMTNVVMQFKQVHIKLWIELFERTQNAPLPEAEFVKYFDRLFEGFQLTTDYPTCAFYRELIQLYPKAKVILTIRDPNQWADSVQATLCSDAMRRNPSLGQRLIYTYYGVRDLWKLHNLMFARTLGPNFATMTRHELIESYLRWNEEVIRHVPSDRLLIFNSSQGWMPLCQFLQFKLPNPEMVYPHLNRRADMIEALDRYLVPGRMLDWFLVFIPVACIFLIVLYK